MKAHRGGRLPPVTSPPATWRSPRVDLRDGRFTARTRIAWDTAATWAAGYRLLEARQGKVGPDKFDQDLCRHVRALAAELGLLTVASLADLEWVRDIMRDAPGPRVTIIDAVDRQLAQARRRHGADDGSRVYTVIAPRGHTGHAPWDVFRKGGVGLVRVRADIAAERLAPLMAGRRAIEVRAWARGTGYMLRPHSLLSEFVGTIEVIEVLTPPLASPAREAVRPAAAVDDPWARVLGWVRRSAA